MLCIHHTFLNLDGLEITKHSNIIMASSNGCELGIMLISFLLFYFYEIWTSFWGSGFPSGSMGWTTRLNPYSSTRLIPWRQTVTLSIGSSRLTSSCLIFTECNSCLLTRAFSYVPCHRKITHPVIEISFVSWTVVSNPFFYHYDDLCSSRLLSQQLANHSNLEMPIRAGIRTPHRGLFITCSQRTERVRSTEFIWHKRQHGHMVG